MEKKEVNQTENQHQAKPRTVEKVAKERYDCVSLALKDTKAMLAARTAEVETLSARLTEAESELAEVKADMAHLVKVMARIANP